MRAEMGAIERRPGPNEIEFRMLRADGTVRWILDRGEVVGPVSPGSGRVSRVTGTVLDITERKLAEETLGQSEQSFRLLVEQTPDGIFLADAQGRYVALSSSRGTVSIGWKLDGAGVDGSSFHLSWTERNGPVVAETPAKGFGTQVITTMPSLQLGGEAILSFAPGGVVWSLMCPAADVIERQELRESPSAGPAS